jgi:hypothetical protein
MGSDTYAGKSDRITEKVTALRGKRSRIWENNIKRDVKNVRFEDVCWFKAILDRVHGRTVVHTVMKFRGPMR